MERITSELQAKIRDKTICALWEAGYNTFEIASMIHEKYGWQEPQVDDFIFEHYVVPKMKRPSSE